MEETMAWAADNGSGQPPTVDAAAVVGDIPGAVPSPATITLTPGTSIVACISPDEIVCLGGVITVS